MIALREIYNSRKEEIDNFIEVIKFLQNKEQDKDDDGRSKFDKFFHGQNGINLSYQAMTNILKSNVALMMYNLIEFTVANLMECIYDRIKLNNLSYLDVNSLIKKLWTKTILKAVNDPNANFNTFIKKNEEIINKIIGNTVIELRARDTLPAGNLDGITIKETFEKHGVSVNTSSSNYRPDILDSIKEKRNNLAHGTVSFVEALRDVGILDIEKNEKFIANFLEEIINNVSQYLANESYKVVRE